MRHFLFLLFAACTLLASGGRALAGADLAIGDDEIYRRPNSWSQNELGGPAPYKYAASRTGVSIAWRNADQIEEVEVRVVNLGNAPGTGKLSVDVVDDKGRVLLSLSPPDGQEIVQMPAADQGGLQGKIIRMKASWELNGLIDRFDMGHVQYGVMATIAPVTQDDNLLNNRKCKTWNNMARVQPGGTNTFNYAFVNSDSVAHDFRLHLETNHLPPDWVLKDSNEDKGVIHLNPGDTINGTLSLKVPDKIEEGAFSEARLALVNTADGTVYRQHEWFEIYDTVAPVISNYRAVLLQNHTIAIQALVADQQSGVLEATGVSTQFSLDGGKTWAARAHNYKTGNFIRPTLFETVLGPFPPKTNVLLRMTAKDTAGNVAWRIPDDASAYTAPAGTEKLIQLAFIFPRTKPNPIFEVEGLKALAQSVHTVQKKGTNIQKMNGAQLAELGVAPARLAELGVDEARFQDIKADVNQLGLLNLNFDQIHPTALRRVRAAGETVMPVNTVELTIQ